jgi:nitroreductase
MDALECIETRRSVRKFRDKPLEFEKVGNILNAGRLAPSAGNLQDWKFVLVTERDLRHQLAEACSGQHWMSTAPIHIVICSQPAKEERMYGKRGEELYSIQNAAAAAQNMLLAAHAQGVGACWVSAFEDHLVRRALQMPDSARPLAVLVFGHPDEEPVAPPKYSVSDVTFVERWGTRIKDIAAYFGYYSQHVAEATTAAREHLQKFLKKWTK